MELLSKEGLRERPARVDSAECFQPGFRRRSVVSPVEGAIGLQRRLYALQEHDVVG